VEEGTANPSITAGVAIGLACPRTWCGVFREAGRLNMRISATVATARVEISDSDQASRSSVPAKIPWRIASGQTAYDDMNGLPDVERQPSQAGMTRTSMRLI
jgi:hypothetical protein